MQIKTEELLQQIKNLLKEEFVAEIVSDDDTILLRFTNGQVFKMILKRIS